MPRLPQTSSHSLGMVGSLINVSAAQGGTTLVGQVSRDFQLTVGYALAPLDGQDADGLLNVMAEETTSGVKSDITVKPSYGLADDEIARMLKESFQQAEADKFKKEAVEKVPYLAWVSFASVLNATLWWLNRSEGLESYDLDTHVTTSHGVWPFGAQSGWATAMTMIHQGKVLSIWPTSLSTEAKRAALYDPATKQWTKLDMGAGRGNTAMMHSSGKVILMGGMAGGLMSRWAREGAELFIGQALQLVGHQAAHLCRGQRRQVRPAQRIELRAGQVRDLRRRQRRRLDVHEPEPSVLARQPDHLRRTAVAPVVHAVP